MAENEKFGDQAFGHERNGNRGSCTGRNSEQRAQPRPSTRPRKVDEGELPAPPPDPWSNLWPSLHNSRDQQVEAGRNSRSLDEDEDMIAYLTDDLGSLPPFEGRTPSGCPSRNSAVSAMAISSVYAEDAFEHLDRLYAFVDQILELRDRNAKFFKRVRNLERLKVLRDANQKLEYAFARDNGAATAGNACEEDTGFAESLLDAMLSNCRDSPFQRRGARSGTRQASRNNKLDIDVKQTSVDEISGTAPKVSKWTRVKAAFKWERAYTNDTENTDSGMAPPSSFSLPPTSKQNHRNHDVDARESSNTATSSPVNENCNVGTPVARTSSPSSSNDGFYDCQKSGTNQVDCQSLKRKSNKKDFANWHSESLDDNILMDTLQPNETAITNEASQGKPLIRITSDKSHAGKMDEKDVESISKRSTPTLTIAIPSHEEDIRYTSSPESSSPLFFNANASAGNSPQHRKTYRDQSVKNDFKRQQSYGGETLMSKMQRQDSKWNKVRRAFLTNSTPNVPSNLNVPRQTLFQDGFETSISSNYDSVENMEKTTPSNTPSQDTRQDYRALREKLGTEFHQKLIEWERLKNFPPRVSTTKETFSNLPSPRESLLSEERLAPEFRKKLQDWKRAKKIRRGSAPFVLQQRLNRRRLTDWQLWRSPLKTEFRNKEIFSFAGGESGEIVNDGRTQVCEDYPKKMEPWKRANESNCDAKSQTRTKSHQLASGIDESEFLALERLLSLFNNNTSKERRDSDVQQLDECFDGDARSCADGTQNLNDTNEVFVRTSVGSYRFEGISREFTRKLYDWEQYRGISPTSSTFRLLGPSYIPFLRQTTMETSTDNSPITKVGSDEPISFKVCSLKRSKSVGNVIEQNDRNELFIRRSNSLQSLDHLTNRLKDADRIDALQESIDPQRPEDIVEDIMDDSEPEAMIVDIEDVIEETASPLERVQPHQTPVYSVAASETTSIAVPLGTVTSSHEPSPVFLIEIEENSDSKRWESKKWNQRKSVSSEDSLSLEQSEMAKSWDNERNSSSNVDSEHWSSASSWSKRETFDVKENVDNSDRELDKDSVKSNNSIYSTDVDTEFNVVNEGKEQNQVNFEREDVPVTLPEKKDGLERNLKEYDEQSKFATRNVGRFYTNQDQKNVKKTEETYTIMDKVLDTAHRDLSKIELDTNRYDSSRRCINYPIYEKEKDRFKEATRSSQSVERKKWQEYRNTETASSSLLSNPSSFERHREPTIQTTAYTVAPSRDQRCFERIVINEETLNKIVVPTATGCVEKASISRSPIERAPVEDSADEYRSSNDRDVPVSRETSTKKQISNSPTRNVFIRTKRIIFSPFRRSEEHSSGKKENNEDDRVFPTKSKSKSRSGSPKVNRQDALLRMSLSLPWPLRPSSKDRETKESKIEEERAPVKQKQNFKRCKSVESSRKSSVGENVFQTRRDRDSSIEFKNSTNEKNERGSVSVQTDERENRAPFRVSLPSLKTVEKTKENSSSSSPSSSSSSSTSSSSSSSRFDPQSSDLIHKLTILSNAVARRDGRTNTISEESSLVESHSLRVRRAKEDFLSRRGGPLCHSALEPPSVKRDDSPRTLVHFYEQISENQERMGSGEQTSSVNRAPNSLLDASREKEGQQQELATKEKRMEHFLNDYNELSNGSRPDRVKSASAGMINVDPDTFVRLTETSRGCESLPRSISKQPQPLGSLAKIVNKLKFTRLIRSKDAQEENMSTISKLCRQSLLIDVRNDFDKCWESNDREKVPKAGSVERNKKNE
ncbi:uncharacterized protein LOC107992694 isoform X2 [Apis cerana]|uniref:uncharacterized protein LOC107992694 isoform X2 n=1 Tax=Apis cerana TaxID=7461 RepID=UPI002B2391DA|nr:uncharacterized protein LOC107992694 isoform X2 [Apis cerana]